MKPILEILAEDKSLITYRPRMNRITGSVTSTILLQQILYWHKKNDGKPFYKFKEPCGHTLYKEGDSWCEELGFSRSEFDIALSNLAVKRNKGNKDNLPDAFIYYWITPDRITYYTVNEEYLFSKILPLYVTQEPALGKDEKEGTEEDPQNSLVKPKSDLGSTKISDTKHNKDVSGDSKSGESKSSSTGIEYTEITSETTPKSYLIIRGALDDTNFRKAFNDFLIEDSNQYRDDTLFWINHNAEKYGCSLHEVTHALKVCMEKNKEGEMSYFTGILRKKAEAKGEGVKGFGKRTVFAIYEYLKHRLRVHMEYVTNYDLDMEKNILYFSIRSKEDREPVEDLFKMICEDIKSEFDIILQPKLRLKIA